MRYGIAGLAVGMWVGVACGGVAAPPTADTPAAYRAPSVKVYGVPVGKGGRVHLCILSGQSNMVGLNPEVSFTPALTNAFPADTIIVVKDSSSGRPIRDWYGEPTPKDPEGHRAALYVRMMGNVRAALSNAHPDTVTFVWMQGEADGHTNGAVDYRACLAGLVGLVRRDLGRQDVNVVIGRISDFANTDPARPNWMKVREAEVAFAESDPRAAWVDTDDLNGPKNALHYPPQGYATLGQRFADKTIALIRRGTAP